jgi:DNA-binding protein H-NS
MTDRELLELARRQREAAQLISDVEMAKRQYEALEALSKEEIARMQMAACSGAYGRAITRAAASMAKESATEATPAPAPHAEPGNPPLQSRAA